MLLIFWKLVLNQMCLFCFCSFKFMFTTQTPTHNTHTQHANKQRPQQQQRRLPADDSAVLDEMATISAVLYANTSHPELKIDYPNWNERCKQILKKWRALSTDKKAPFLQKARDNRSALRMKKAQHVSTQFFYVFLRFYYIFSIAFNLNNKTSLWRRLSRPTPLL